MSKTFALNAFNAAVVLSNAAHGAKRMADASAIKLRTTVVKTVSKGSAAAREGSVAGKEAGIAFWAGFKYANEVNRTKGTCAERLTKEDIAASKPSKKTGKRVVTK